LLKHASSPKNKCHADSQSMAVHLKRGVAATSSHSGERSRGAHADRLACDVNVCSSASLYTVRGCERMRCAVTEKSP